MQDDGSVRKRRVRYSGKNPRKFEEKYKELNPQLYSSEIQKVMDRGETPAGMHRPIMVQEIMDILKPEPGQRGLDATLGFGGHTQEFLKRILPGGHLTSLDVDPLELPKTEARLRGLGFSEEVLSIRLSNFAGLHKFLPSDGEGFDFILADLGISSMQLDNPARGFSFKADGALDLRLNPERGRPASDLIKALKEDELVEILFNNADEPHAPSIAKAVIAKSQEIDTTIQLADVITQALQHIPARTRQEEIKRSIQRSFQALRIAVNDEFGALDRLLSLLPYCLKSGGRVAILSFHSGEDRRVKKSFLEGLNSGTYSEIADEPMRSSGEERRANPRSSCAKLRWAVKK